MENRKLAVDNQTHVLYIDDEVNNLNSFKAGFRREFSVYTAESALEALKVLTDNPKIQVIISDQRMPGMTGVEFFEKVISIYPDKIRILLTGYSDIEAVVNAINKGQVYRFIDKPWDQDSVRMAVKNAREIFDARHELVKKNESLKKAYEELDRFVYSVSHDLRAPLMSIVGLINLAEEELGDDKALEYLGMIRSMTDKLDNFVHQIIDYYKSTHDHTFKDAIDFQKMIDDIMDEFRYHPNAASIKSVINIRQSEGFVTNRMKLKTILNNLISNAIKYQRKENADQFIKVDVGVDNGVATITVSDNGIGVPADHTEKIFQMFHRATNDDTGSGLGLFIVKEAVDSLGGSISIKSTEGEGTTFTLVIPSKNVQ